MESQNVRRALDAYDAWNRGDLEAILADVPPEFEFHTTGVVPEFGSVLRGKEGLRRLFTEWYTEAWDGPLETKIHEVQELDPDHLLVLLVFRGRGRGSGAEVTLPYGHLLTFREGVNIRVDGFADWESAREAARSRGLSPKA